LKEISGWYKKNLPSFGLGASSSGPAKIEEKKEEKKVEEKKEV
jgi:hypothetical protein